MYLVNSTLYLDPIYTAPPSLPVGEPATVAPEEILNTDPRTVTIRVIPFDESRVLISHYQIIVVYLPPGTNVEDLSHPDVEFPNIEQRSDLPCGNKPPNPLAYVTAEMSRDSYNTLLTNGLFVVGQNKDDDPSSPNDHPDITNGPLCYSTRYSFFIRGYSVSSTKVSILLLTSIPDCYWDLVAFLHFTYRGQEGLLKT